MNYGINYPDTKLSKFDLLVHYFGAIERHIVFTFFTILSSKILFPEVLPQR